MNYAIELTAEFLAAFEQLDPLVQEVVLDHLDVIAERAGDEGSGQPLGLEPVVGWHRHRGTIEGLSFDVTSWLVIDHAERRVIASDISESDEGLRS